MSHLENLHKDIKIYLLKFLDIPSGRNYLLCCASVYYAIPFKTKQQYLGMWLKLLKYNAKNTHPRRIHIRGNKTCHTCGGRFKYLKHIQKCRGVKQCYICWTWIPVRSDRNTDHIHGTKFSQLICQTCISDTHWIECKHKGFIKQDNTFFWRCNTGNNSYIFNQRPPRRGTPH